MVAYNNNGYSALGLVWQEPEPSQETGVALNAASGATSYGEFATAFPRY